MVKKGLVSADDVAADDAEEAPSKREGLRGVRYFVLDEADRMLDMGFLPQVREVVELMGGGLGESRRRQSLMFSATWPPSVHACAKEFLSERPAKLFIDQDESSERSANSNVTQAVEILPEADKDARMLKLLEEELGPPGGPVAKGKCLVFANTKVGCAALSERVRRAGYPCGEMHGNLRQADRSAALAEFTDSTTRCLVATDVAARGIDVEDISLVICYDFPDSMVGGLDDYVHRVGRTGRADRKGRAVTFFPAPQDVSGTRSAGNAHELIKILRAAGQHVSKELEALDRGPQVPKGKGKDKGKGKGGKKRESTDDLEEGFPSKRRRAAAGGIVVEGADGKAAPAPLQQFSDTPFNTRVKKEFKKMGFKEPTPIQAHGWPLLLRGWDCIGIAKTGSGKTIAYLLPALHKMRKWLKNSDPTDEQQGDMASGPGPLALVVAPTRELAVQIHGEAERFKDTVPCRTACAYGGAPWEPQAALVEAGVELLVATPGRLSFLMCRGGEAAAALARTIASLAAQKQLAKAKEALQEFLANGGTLSRRILSTYMNAHVLCGDLAGATEVVALMERSGFSLGVVEHTTLLKGEAAVGDFAGMERVIAKMEAQQPAIKPDVRVANTFLRGCLRLGELQAAIDLYHERLPAWEVRPDAATLQLLAKALAQQLRLKDLLQLMDEPPPLAPANATTRILDEGAAEAGAEAAALQALDMAATLGCCAAQAALLLAKRKSTSRGLAHAEAAIAKADQERPSFHQPSREFDQLRRRELSREVASLRGNLAKGRSSVEEVDIVSAFGRLFPFAAVRGSEAPSGAADAGARELALAALRRGFGLEECFRRGLSTEEDFEQSYKRCFGKGGRLRWPSIFGHNGRPTRLEVCSGTGDWVVAQAKAEAGTANWVASELRYDRTHSIFAKMALERLDNLAILAGDAGAILARGRVPPASLSHVCVNFPEPPQTTRHASCDEAESRLHLLTGAFFRDVHRVLADDGMLTILSDNQEYMLSLARTLGDLFKEGGGGRLFAPSAEVPAEHLTLAEQENGMLVYWGTPGPEVGHMVAADSQFDRFFAHGGHGERYYIAVDKQANT